MYLSLEDKGSVFSILKNWPERRVKAICLTDGSRVGTLWDLGVQVGGWGAARRERSQRTVNRACLLACGLRAAPSRPGSTSPALTVDTHPCPQAIGLPISRLSLYTACGGIVPSAALPITMDVGTDNEALLQAGWGLGAVLLGMGWDGRRAGMLAGDLPL